MKIHSDYLFNYRIKLCFRNLKAIFFKCDDGFSPSLAMDGDCQPDGNWQLDSAGIVCAASMTLTGKLKLKVIK